MRQPTEGGAPAGRGLGPAGVGKSRLAGSSRSTSTGWSTELVAPGLCLSYGEGVSFWALAEMVRQRLGIAEDDPRDSHRQARAGPGSVRAGPDERAYVGTRLARLSGARSPATGGNSARRSSSPAGGSSSSGWRRPTR